jgi:ribose transport system substrate-binding protein
MKKATAFVGLAIGAMVMSGCGSTAGGSDDSSTSGGDVPAAVTKLVDEASKPQAWQGPTTSPPALKGKFIVSIPCSMAAGCSRWDAGVHAAGKALGWKVQTIDPAFDINKMNQAIEQAINLKADAIVTTTVDPAWVASSVAAARRKGIVVLSSAVGYEDAPIKANGFQHEVSLHGVRQGEWLAAQTCADIGAKGHVIIVNDPSFNILKQRVKATTEYFSKNCPKIKVTVEKISAQDVGTVLQNKVSALVQKNPDLKALITPVDIFTTDIVTVLQQLGNKDIKVYSIDGDPSSIHNVADDGAVKATVGSALEWEGWSSIDEVNRLLQGEPTIKDDGVPGRMVTKKNIPDGFKYKGDLDYEAMFTELWKTGTLKP